MQLNHVNREEMLNTMAAEWWIFSVGTLRQEGEIIQI
jgi:hypothetical protein